MIAQDRNGSAAGAATNIGGKASISDDEALALLNHLIRPNGWHVERAAQEQLWLRCLAFFAGKQHFIQDGFTLREPLRQPKHRVQYKANKMLGNILRAVSKIDTISWEGAVAPASDAPLDLYKAELSEKIASHIQEVVGHSLVRTYALTWAAICGTGFTRLRWDPDRGDPDRFYLQDDGQSVAIFLSDAERRERERRGLFEDSFPGEIVEEVESPFKVYHDWNSRERGVEGCAWMASVSFVPVLEAADTWGLEPRSIQREESQLGPQYYEDAIAFLSTGRNGLNQAMPSPRDRSAERCRVVEYFERPLRRNGFRGRHIVAVGQVVVRNQDNFFRATGFALPWTKWDWIPMPGRFWGLGLGEQLINPQYNYNRARAAIIEHQNVFGAPPTFVPEGSGIPTGQLTTLPGSVLSYNPSAGPIIIGKAPSLPKEVAENAMMCAGDMQEISANIDPDASSLPGQIRSGAGLRAMMEEKHLALHPTAKAAIAAEHRCTKMMLGLAKVNYTEQRVLKHQGRNGGWVVNHFMGTDINTDLRITMDTMRFQSIATQQAELLDLVQVGALNPMTDPEDRAAVRDAIHFNVGRDVLAEKAREGMNQDEEIERIIADPVRFLGRPLQVNPWDDHAEHARAAKRFLRSDRAKRLDPGTLQLIVQHWMQHEQIAQEAIMRNMQAMAMLRGSAAEKGRASQPAM